MLPTHEEGLRMAFWKVSVCVAVAIATLLTACEDDGNALPPDVVGVVDGGPDAVTPAADAGGSDASSADVSSGSDASSVCKKA